VDIRQSTPYPDEPFDCIAAIDVLEHDESYEDSFRRIVAKLKRGGYLAISSPIDS
jgi:2-polyprenyl-3-methyl-5-hydroxy-6-metoxy-1,4-benzoquinol methylase